jgi:hypothetical protein
MFSTSVYICVCSISCLALFISIHYDNNPKAPTLMYFIWIITINVHYKRKVRKTKGNLINIFTRQVTDKGSSYESLNSSFFMSGIVSERFTEYTIACIFGF